MKYEMFKKSIRINSMCNKLNKYFPENSTPILDYSQFIASKQDKEQIKYYFDIYFRKNLKMSIDILKYLIIYQKSELVFELLSTSTNVEDNVKEIEKFIQHVGDYYLFVKNDLKNAEKFYSLLNKNDNKEEYFRCFENELRLLEIMKISDKKVFNSMINIIMLNNDTNYERIVNDCNAIFKEFNKLDINKYKDNDIRAIYICILKIINKTIFYNLYCLMKEENININDNTMNNIFELISIDSNQELGIYSKFILNSAKSIDLLNEVFDIVSIINSIKTAREKLLVKNVKTDLAYYTSLESFSYLLPYKHTDNMEGHLTLMNVSYMNDPSEGTVLYEFLNCKNNDEKRRNAKIPYVFLKSFTPSVDYLPMWDMYAGGASGLCVILDWQKMLKKSRTNINLYRICYIDASNKSNIVIHENENKDIKEIDIVGKELNNIKKVLSKYKKSQLYIIMIKSLESIAYLFKESHYYTEKELRIIESEEYFDDNNIKISKNNDKPINIYECPLIFKYSDYALCIKEIIVGPKFVNANSNMPYIQSQIEKMCKKNDVDVPEITYSKIDYR